MNRKTIFVVGLVSFFAVILFLTATKIPAAANPPSAESDIVRGAMLYDNWLAVKGSNAPDGNMPIWNRQTTDSTSGADTWRCVSCHGWDYQGKDGAYRAGSHFTGFPSVFFPTIKPKPEEIVAILKGMKDKEHDFSKYLDESNLNDLALFITDGLVDDSEYIDPVSLKVLNGDEKQGKTLYEKVCAECHGTDGTKLTFRFEGRDATLGTMAIADPWRFLHRTRFGNPGTHMAIGHDLGWMPQNGRDVLLYAQSLPSGLEAPAVPPVMDNRPTTDTEVGGPPETAAGGILTGIFAMVIGLGWNLIIFAALLIVILLLVWLLRSRKTS
ncbi:MAG: cytochrome c [Anaerolineaceae bacterium]|nr:cytochrome c [Anaerolineaceae bacterium]